MVTIWLRIVPLLLLTAVSTSFRTPSSFLGRGLASSQSNGSFLMMRKQKASDKRTRRKQKGEVVLQEKMPTFLRSHPMSGATWRAKQVETIAPKPSSSGGRGRSRKRTMTYQTLQSYQDHFLFQLTAEYKAEEDEVLGRIRAGMEDPIGLEQAGFALYDMVLERRGNLYSDEVYRLCKSPDATTVYGDNHRTLPENHKFSINDVIVLTHQAQGPGGYFSTSPLSKGALTVEARVLNMGPTYLDICLPAGMMEGTMGTLNADTLVRVDRFVSQTPYQRMVDALSRLTAVPKASSSNDNNKTSVSMIQMDSVLRDVILQTHAFSDLSSPSRGDPDVCDLNSLAHLISKPPTAYSQKQARQTVQFMQKASNFPTFNAPQRASITAALSRRLTLIHGPPGTGKTTVASAIGFGFVEQARRISDHTKVLACAFSNVGADNLAEGLLRLGLKVIRVGKASGVAESLWEHTLDAAINRDPEAQAALDTAAKATAQLKKRRQPLSERTLRDAATLAVKNSIEASNIAATKALREADIIVSTSTGAADRRLLAACGIVMDGDESGENDRVEAPDGLPPLSLPFVLVDEACQSVEPATLIPIVVSNSCRSLVLLGDPCQLPATVRSQEADALPLSLMERLATVLPHPSVIPEIDSIAKDTTFLDAKPVKQAVSLSRAANSGRSHSYRKVYPGSLLLSIQYRMHPSIAALPSALFYDGLLSTPAFMRENRFFPTSLRRSMPCGTPDMCVRFIDVGGRDNERQGIPSKYTDTVYGHLQTTEIEPQTTFWNEAEAARVVSLIQDLVDGNDVRSIGVVSPYSGQVQLIKTMIAKDGRMRESLRNSALTIEVKTVDGYQGRERDVIIFSAVRSNRSDRIGFLNDWRRMNVALTRAKSGLLIVGDMDTLAGGNKYWDALRTWATGARCIVDDTSTDEYDEVSL